MDDPRQLERKLARLEHVVHVQRIGLGLAGGIIVILLGVLLFGKTPRFGRAILVNDTVVAMVKNERAAAAVRERLLAEGRKGFEGVATFREKWEDATRPVDGAEILSVGQAVKALRPKLTVVVEACAIEANGTRLLVVPNESVATDILNKLKARYASQTDAVVKATRLKPEPVLRSVTVPPGEIVSEILQGVERLSQARATPRAYTVKPGDYPERIAEAQQMRLADLYRLNPGLKGTTLRVGQKLTVLGPGVGLTVVTIKETACTELIPPPVSRVRSDKLPQGQTKVQHPGQPGKKRVRCEVTMHNEREVSRRVLSEEVVLAPQPKRVLVGTAPPSPA
ncbi:MAG: LysM peptidoglycan-binding domain-containing protein [Armatimonadetes bacterium]|nr:LysM peptidoglycan-binding domain-containing protein [Armatimonadota bacterium]